MAIIRILKPFSFAHGGWRVETFEPGDEPVETSDECAAVAVQEGWAEPVEQASAHEQAPETADAAPRRRTKG